MRQEERDEGLGCLIYFWRGGRWEWYIEKAKVQRVEYLNVNFARADTALFRRLGVIEISSVGLRLPGLYCSY